ncbi:MAG: D-aminoacyl-tRNA deacylase [Dehalogenimonas sp.]|uniref:D-aminoacyl-tRNA deacylase n=1 Tax=Candidatus Dehalogenimonas loeffleri TaxID=3127115 RepID=A0ABZ2J8X7_9CHLR|nr:D-aminoacyl-tRNA deacylase [Dehalogenimonas sp.]
MKALIQRVSRAQVSVDDEVIGRITAGLLVFIGIARGDEPADIDYLVNKLVNLRIFADEQGKFNLSMLDVKGDLLLVSQFTLIADTRKGRRPSFTDAAPPEQADRMFNDLVAEAVKTGLRVATGRFQAHMMVELVNDGPVTIMLDSRDRLLPRA